MTTGHIRSFDHDAYLNRVFFCLLSCYTCTGPQPCCLPIVWRVYQVKRARKESSWRFLVSSFGFVATQFADGCETSPLLRPLPLVAPSHPVP